MTTQHTDKALEVLNILQAEFTQKQAQGNRDSSRWDLRGTLPGMGEIVLGNRWNDESKLHVFFQVPAEWTRDFYCPEDLRAAASGNFSWEKSAKQIAREIQRRLFPRAANRFAHFQKCFQGRQQRYEAQRNGLQVVADVVPGAMVANRFEGGRETTEPHSVKFPGSFGSQIPVEVTSYDSHLVKFSVNCSPAVAARLLRAYLSVGAVEGGGQE